MAYKKVTEEEFMRWAQANPGMVGRVNGQEIKAPVQQAQDLGFLGNLLRGVTKPVRAVASMPEYLIQALQAADKGQTGMKPGQFKSIFLTPEEELAWGNDPVKQGLKTSTALGSFLLPGGGGGAPTALGRIGKAAGRSTVAGTVGGLGYSEDGQELQGMGLGALTGFLTGGALQGAGEGIRAIRGAGGKASKGAVSVYLDDITDVKKVAELPSKAKSSLRRLAKSSGFDDPNLSESKNILNYINNRKFAGATPGETLENMTQEFANASKLKKAGIGEIGGLSKGYIENIKQTIDDSIQFSGLGATETNVLERMKNTLDKAPRDATTLDKIAQDWYKMGITRAGEQKMTQSGLYMNGAKAIRDALKEANGIGGSYTSAMTTLSKILGLEDEGAVSAAAAQAEKTGINIPMFQNAGVYGTDVKMPSIANAINKAQTAMAQKQLQSSLSGAIPGTQGVQQELPNLLKMLIGGGQRAVPAMTYAGGQVQMPGGMVDEAPEMNLQQTQGKPAMNGINLMLAQGILSGKISASEAEAVLSLLGMSGAGGAIKQTEAQRDYQLAAEAIEQAYGVLEQTGGAGKLATAGGNIAGFFGATSPSSEYRAALDTATAFLRKALIGSGQSEAELKNLNLPKPTDEPALARQKILTLIPLLRARAGLQEY